MRKSAIIKSATSIALAILFLFSLFAVSGITASYCAVDSHLSFTEKIDSISKKEIQIPLEENEEKDKDELNENKKSCKYSLFDLGSTRFIRNFHNEIFTHSIHCIDWLFCGSYHAPIYLENKLLLI